MFPQLQEYEQERRSTEQERLADARRIISQPVSPSLFRPEGAKDFKRFVEAAAIVDYWDKGVCLERLYASQGRRWNGTRVRNSPEDAACTQPNVAKALSDLTDGLRMWSAQAPATIEGLKQINIATKAYTSLWSDLRVRGYTEDAPARAVQAARSVLNARRDALIPVLRPEILSRINLAGQDLLTEELFDSDPALLTEWEYARIIPSYRRQMEAKLGARIPFYKTADPRWASAREREGRLVGDPTDEEIAYALLRTMKRNGGRLLAPFTASVPHADARFGSSFGDALSPMILQVHDIQKVRCTPEGRGRRCAFKAYFLILTMRNDPLSISLNQAANANYGALASTLLVPGPGGWTAPEFEGLLLKAHANEVGGFTQFFEATADAVSTGIGIVDEVANPKISPQEKRERERREQQEREEAEKLQERRSTSR